MQIKTTMRYYFSPIRNYIIKTQTEIINVGEDVDKLEPCGMVIPEKIKHRIIMRPSNSTSGYTFKRIGIRDSKRYLYTYSNSSIIHNS
jgi:hypothetical protein